MRILLSSLAIAIAAFPAYPIGTRAHAEIGEQAVARFLGQVDEMLPGAGAFFANEDNLRALYAGCLFPDWGYGGINQDAAEASHWNPFHTAYVEVLRRRFPPPWDAEAQKQIAFFLGIICHSIADIPWHFSEESNKSFLQTAQELGGANHTQSEFVSDVFLFAEGSLKPALSIAMWWPFEVIEDAFKTAGISVKRNALEAGTTRGQSYFFGGPLIGLARAAVEKTKYPWIYAHYKDYYYGGLDHGAAVSSEFFRYYYAALQGAYYYQNAPLYASYVRRNSDYAPKTPVEDAHIIQAHPENNTGGEPLLELTGDGPDNARRGLLHFDVRDIPPATDIQRAVVWLHFAGRRGGLQTAPKTIEAHFVRRFWNAGGTRTNEVNGVDGAPAAEAEVTWEQANGVPWSAPGAELPSDDRDAESISSATIGPNDLPGRWMAWDITPAVRRWVEQPEQNFGLVFRETEDSALQPGILQFFSSEAFREYPDSVAGGNRVAWRPILIVVPAANP